MPYSELMIRPMREELTRIGVEELRTPEQVDNLLQNTNGTVMVVVNSICGCAAGKARPGIAQALQHEVKPDRVATGARSLHGQSVRGRSVSRSAVSAIARLLRKRQVEQLRHDFAGLTAQPEVAACRLRIDGNG